MSDDDAYVLDMLQCARRAAEALGSQTVEEFLSDWRTQSVAQHQLIILGEAAKRLSPEFRERHSQFSWRDIAGRRDVLVHRYSEVDLPEIWRVVAQDLPPLIRFLESIAPKPQS